MGTYNPHAYINQRWEWEVIPFTDSHLPSTDPNVIELLATEYITYLSDKHTISTIYIGGHPIAHSENTET